MGLADNRPAAPDRCSGGSVVSALTIKQAAERLAVGEATVRRLVREGAITHVHVGSRVRIGDAQLDAYVAGERSTQVCDTCRPAAAAALRSAS